MTENETPAAPERATERPETPRPRRARGAGRDRSRTIWIAVAAVGIAALVVFGFVGWGVFQDRLEAARNLDEARALIEDADAVVVAVDRVVREEVTPALASEARAADDRIPGATESLKEAASLIGRGDSKRTKDERELAALLRTAAEARIDMLAQAPAILALTTKAAGALDPAVEGWEAVLAADKLSDQAVVAYNKLTKAGVQESSKLNKQAADKLEVARSAFSKAEAAFPEAPFESYLAYVDTRIRLNKLSQQSDQAWLKGDVAGANSVANQYNVLDKQAVDEAKKLPPSPEQAVATAYENAAGSATDAYYAARDAATQADQQLRRSF